MSITFYVHLTSDDTTLANEWLRKNDCASYSITSIREDYETNFSAQGVAAIIQNDKIYPPTGTATGTTNAATAATTTTTIQFPRYSSGPSPSWSLSSPTFPAATPPAEITECQNDIPSGEPTSIWTSCSENGNHRGYPAIIDVEWRSWTDLIATGEGTYTTGQSSSGQAYASQWGIDVSLSSPQWYDGDFLFTYVQITCDSSVHSPNGQRDTPGDCSDMAFPVPQPSGN